MFQLYNNKNESVIFNRSQFLEITRSVSEQPLEIVELLKNEVSNKGPLLTLFKISEADPETCVPYVGDYKVAFVNSMLGRNKPDEDSSIKPFVAPDYVSYVPECFKRDLGLITRLC